MVEIRLYPFGSEGPDALTGRVPIPPEEGDGDDNDFVPLIEDSPPPVDDDGEIEEGKECSEGNDETPGDTTITPDGEIIEIDSSAGDATVVSSPPRRVSSRVRAARKVHLHDSPAVGHASTSRRPVRDR